MLRAACVEAKSLQDAGLPPITFAINLSARQFRQKNLPSMIRQILADTGLSPQYLSLEITEETMMQLGDETVQNLNDLKEIGVSLALDDFGTGYSSLSYLSRFPVDSLKIDRSFIDEVASARSHASITAAIIAMGHSLNMEVVAEGVETEAQMAFLAQHGCDIVQGFFFSHPLPFADLREFMSDEVSVDSFQLSGQFIA
jgi:EAL domain-containing protein (putative c-di-GMP-specific phosphodiesterase class I)